MQLNRFTDLGLRILLLLQQRSQQTALSTVDGLANELQVSRHHLVKIVHFMAQSNWIKSYKGRAGGIHLAEDTAQQSLGNIIWALEKASSQQTALINCQKPPCSLTGNCRLPPILDTAQQAFYQQLNHYKLQDLVPNKTHTIHWLTK